MTATARTDLAGDVYRSGNALADALDDWATAMLADRLAEREASWPLPSPTGPLDPVGLPCHDAALAAVTRRERRWFRRAA